jgi:hypothetical protein
MKSEELFLCLHDGKVWENVSLRLAVSSPDGSILPHQVGIY